MDKDKGRQGGGTKDGSSGNGQGMCTESVTCTK
jgi:hypothetical protein